MRSLVEAARVGRLATVSDRGMPHLVPVCFAVVDEVAYSAVDHKPKSTPRLQRIVDIEATGRACLLVDEYDDADWSRLWWVRLEGPARVVLSPVELDVGRSALARKYPQYDDHPLTGAVIALDVSRWSGWSASGS
jgi:PPOX class probable F420-dependent enzyme